MCILVVYFHNCIKVFHYKVFQMFALIDKDPLTVGTIFGKTAQFILKNILWIMPFGIFLSLINSPIDYLTLLFGPMDNHTLITYKIGFILIGIPISSLLYGLVTIVLSEQLCGIKFSWYQGFKKILKLWGPLTLLYLTICIACFFGAILLIIPGIIVLCATVCAIPALMLEDLRLWKAIDRSRELTKGHRLRIFGYVILCGLICFVAAFISFSFPLITTASPLLMVGFNVLFMAPFYAMIPAVQTLLFFDLRHREEVEKMDVVPV